MNKPSKAPAIWLLSADIMSQLGGGFRQQRWCEYLLERGEPIRLFQISGLSDVRWVDVHSVEELRAKRKDWIAAAPPKAGVRDSRGARVARFVKHTFMLDLLLPSTFRVVAILNAMLRDAPPRVALLCSSPPFAMGVIGRILKMQHGDRIVMALDMRDLWSLHTAFPGPKLQKRLVERWVIGGADIFTTVAPALAARFAARFGRKPEVVFNVATHVKPVAADSGSFDWRSVSAQLRAETRKLVYTGSVPAGFYDLDGFLDALEDFSRDPLAQKVQVVFVGAGGEMATRAQKRSLPEGLLVFGPQMSHEAIARVQAAADVLIFLGYQAADNQGQVSIKLFEYFRREKPILPVHIRAESDVDWLLRHYCGENVNLLSKTDLVSKFKAIAMGDIDLPRAEDSLAKDQSLLAAYSRVSDGVVMMIRGNGE